MREIKFRGYSTKDNEWRYGFYVTDNITHEILTKLENNEMYASQIDFISLGQYTGLKDKNGIEIYEGDIVKGNYLKDIAPVEWNDKFCKFDISHRMNISPSDEFEVIGNIYENKDLLKS